MSAVSKLANLWGVLVELEETYGTAPALAEAEDGVLVLEKPLPDVAYSISGERGGGSAPGTAGRLKRVGKGGRYAEVDLVTEMIGPGSAYAASTVPHIHDLMQAAGHTVTVDETGGSESITYAPASAIADWESVAAEIYADGEKYPLNGVYTDLEIESEGGEVPTWTFSAQGRCGTVVDADVPSITYPSDLPAKAVGISLSLGDYGSGKVRSFRFAKGQDISARTDENASDGHAGFAPGDRAPVLEVVVEKTDLEASPYHAAEGLDARALMEAATEIALSLDVGSIQYTNKFSVSASQAQLIEVGDDEDGSVPLWTLTFALNPSTPGGNDDYSIVVD